MKLTRFTSILFLGLLFALPLGQIVLELRADERPQILEIVPAFFEKRLPQFEEELRKQSVVRTEGVPRYQLALTKLFGRGNEKAAEGRDGYLFYTDDLDLLSGPGLFEEGQGGPQAVKVIADFRDALLERNIELLVVPVPIKGMLDGEKLRWPEPEDSAAFESPPANADHERLFEELDLRGIQTLRLWPDLLKLAQATAETDSSGGVYLSRDTHWTPQAMQVAAELIAQRAGELLGESSTGGEAGPFTLQKELVRGEGDLVRMLRLPDGQSPYPPMQLEIQSVRWKDSAKRVQTDLSSDVLLLGDSYTKVFSDPELDLGEAGGLGEHLAWHLGRPLDVIALLGGSATAVRETLERRQGGLDGKRLVIWEVGMRVFAEAESWRKTKLPRVGRPGDSGDPGGAGDPQDGNAPLELIAELVEVSRIPPDFGYEFCLVIHEYKVLGVPTGSPSHLGGNSPGDLAVGDSLWAAFAGLENFERTVATKFEPGLRHQLSLEPLEQHYSLEETSWNDETDAGEEIWWVTAWEALP